MRSNNSSSSPGRQVNRGDGLRSSPRNSSLAFWVVASIAALLSIGASALQLSGVRSVTLTGVEQFTVSRGQTTTAVVYEQTPPVGGPHNPVWQNCGIYDMPIPNERGVHSLAHGAVWITYRPDLTPLALQELHTLVQNQPYTVVSPYDELSAPVVGSAWGVQLKVSSPNDARLPLFIATYVQGPQTIEPGKACSGGAGTPVSRSR